MAGLIKLEAGGQKRPFRFRYKAIKSLASDLGVEDLEQLPQKLASQDFEIMESLLFHGFKAGAEYENVSVDFTRENIQDWLDEDVTFFKPALLEAQSQLLAALSGPKTEAGNKPGK